MIEIPCVIFAGGKSSRMGEDKTLLPFGDFKTLTEFQYSRLQKIFSNVYISCKNKNKFDFEASFIEDDVNAAIFAPTAGFIAAFKELNAERFFAISVDSPFINAEIIQTLLDADLASSDATITKTEIGVQPLCGIYHRSLKKEFQKMQDGNNHKLGYLLKNSQTNYVNFQDERAFLNLNQPEEYQEALKLI